MQLKEEITKAEVRNIVKSEVADFLKDKEFEKKVKEITSKVMEAVFKMMYMRKNVWKSEVKNA